MSAIAAIHKKISDYLLQLNPVQKKAVSGIVKAFAAEHDSDFGKEMDRRFADYENGNEKGFTLEETEDRARNAYKSLKK
jgi:hypothetical protein